MKHYIIKICHVGVIEYKILHFVKFLFRCMAEANPEPDIVWRKAGGESIFRFGKHLLELSLIKHPCSFSSMELFLASA
jgi:hypothetical protein